MTNVYREEIIFFSSGGTYDYFHFSSGNPRKENKCNGLRTHISFPPQKHETSVCRLNKTLCEQKYIYVYSNT